MAATRGLKTETLFIEPCLCQAARQPLPFGTWIKIKNPAHPAMERAMLAVGIYKLLGFLGVALLGGP